MSWLSSAHRMRLACGMGGAFRARRAGLMGDGAGGGGGGRARAAYAGAGGLSTADSARGCPTIDFPTSRHGDIVRGQPAPNWTRGALSPVDRTGLAGVRTVRPFYLPAGPSRFNALQSLSHSSQVTAGGGL